MIRVLDMGGQQLVRGEPLRVNADTRVTFAPPKEGAYMVEVRDQFAGGGPRHALLLRVTPPDYSLTVPTDRLTIIIGTVKDMPELTHAAIGNSVELGKAVTDL